MSNLKFAFAAALLWIAQPSFARLPDLAPGMTFTGVETNTGIGTGRSCTIKILLAEPTYAGKHCHRYLIESTILHGSQMLTTPIIYGAGQSGRSCGSEVLNDRGEVVDVILSEAKVRKGADTITLMFNESGEVVELLFLWFGGWSHKVIQCTVNK